MSVLSPRHLSLHPAGVEGSLLAAVVLGNFHLEGGYSTASWEGGREGDREGGREGGDLQAPGRPREEVSV